MHRSWNHQLSIGRSYLAGRSTLSENKQKAYDAIYNGIKNRKSNIILDKNITRDDLKTLFSMIKNDAPGLFWIDNKYTIKCQNNIIILRPNYVYDDSKIKFYKEKLKQTLNELHKTLDNCASELEVEFKVHDYLTSKISYVDSGKIEEHNIIGPLVYNEGVCEGIAASFNFIMNAYGIDCVTIFGTTVDRESHSWNIIKIENDHYHVDITNDLSGTHTFLNINDDLMKKDRVWNSPICCSSMEMNYYIVNNTFFRSEFKLTLYLKRQLQDSKLECEFRIDPDKGLKHIEELVIRSLPRGMKRYKLNIITVGLGIYSIKLA